MAVELENRHLRLGLSDRGLLLRVDDLDSGATRAVTHDGWSVVVDGARITESDVGVVSSEGTETGHRWRFHLGARKMELVYELRPDTRYVRRSLRLGPGSRTNTLTRVEYGPLILDRTPDRVVPYDTFRDCPTVAFLRWDDAAGWFLGVEDPVFETSVETSGDSAVIAQAYAPGLVLAAGEAHVADAQFLGVVGLTGERLTATPAKSRVTLGEPWRQGRFRDPMGHVPIDRGEVDEVRAFIADRLVPLPGRFRSILYTYWYPLPQPPLDADGEARWLRVIDTFADLGGDLLMTTPLVRSALPDSTHDGYWDVAPHGSAAARLMQHARDRGVGVGLYMGVAAGNLEHGNAAALDYPAGAPDSWKKVGEDGTISGENCMASDGFLDWSVAVQANTIERFGLAAWSWDPGPGNGRFCHATGHGHLPGEGSYRGWRNATEVRRRLKERFPDLFLQAFYGQKEDGPWGLRYFDQHEGYWEQQVEWGASIHPDLSSDRINADGIRLQAWSAQNLRFLPASMNHALVGRITQYCMDDPSLAVPWDHAGWRYALLSGIAVGGSITATILPEDLDAVEGMRETYAEWLAWARRHQSLIDRDVAIGAQVGVGGVDIHARIRGRTGVIFLANPGPRAVAARLPLDRSIGLEHAGRFRLVIQTPDRGPCIAGDDGGGDLVAPGDVEIKVPAHTVLVLALEPAEGEAGPVIRSAELRAPTVPVDDWVDDQGVPVSSRHPAARRWQIRATLQVDVDAIGRIRGRRTRDVDRVTGIVAAQRTRGFPDSFAWARPDRSLLVVPFADADLVGSLTLRVNGDDVLIEPFRVAPPGDVRLSGEPLPGRLAGTTICWWADVTEALREGHDNLLELDMVDIAEDQFLGPWVEAPGARWDVEPAGIRSLAASAGPIVASQANGLAALPSVQPSHTHAVPRVRRAWLEPPVLRAGHPVTIRAELDIDEAGVAGVYCSTLVGPGVFTDVALRADGHRMWSHSFLVGDRRDVILDPAVSRVWAVGTDGQPSDSLAIPMRWVLEPRRVEPIGTSGTPWRDR